jgi:hypothetical protein
MAKILYPEVGAGEKHDLDWRHVDYHIACCDCHLVHKFRFAVVGNTLRIRAWRDNRRTAALRRHRGIPIEAHLTQRGADGEQAGALFYQIKKELQMEKVTVSISDEVSGSNAVFDSVEDACKYLIDLLAQRAKTNIVVEQANQVSGKEE